jgi:small subunit ribosomal protein S18
MSEELTTESTGSAGAGAGSRMPTRSKRTFFKKRRSCPFSGPNGQKVDYKNIQLLQKFLSDSGKILPSRITAVSTKHQRHLSRAVKHARFLALIPYIAD